MSDVPGDLELIGPKGAKTEQVAAAFVYPWPVRVWHWLLVGSFIVLAVTGWFIGKPLWTMSGEAGDLYVMGWIRAIHFVTAYVFAISWIARLYFAIVGNEHSRALFWLPVWKVEYWKSLWHEVKFYLFITSEFRPEVGHNALANTAYTLAFVGGSLFMILSGFALYGEALGAGSWASVLFGWFIPLFGQSQTMHMLHRLMMWLIGVTAMAHVYMVFREELASTQTSLSTMINGFRYYRRGGKR